MKTTFKLRLLNIFIVLSIIYNNANASIERSVSTRLTGSQIDVGQSISVLDNKYPDVRLSNTAYINYSIGKVFLAIDHTSQSISYNLMSYNFNFNVVVRINYELADGTIQSTDQSLKLNYSNLSSGIVDKSFAIVKGAHLMSIAVLRFEQDNVNPSLPPTIISTPTIPSNLYLEAEIETERFYPLNLSTVLTANHNYITASNELEVYWSPIVGAEEYELEWTYTNSYDASSSAYDYYPSSGTGAETINNIAYGDVKFSFLQNATKIRTTKNSFKIGLNYNSGLLVYRVRPIGKDVNDINFETVGAWTIDQAGITPYLTLNTLSPATNDYYNITNSHEENKNWQYTVTYAEGGKKKEVISYFDGSQRNRQTVTKTNTEDLSIIAETIYDKQGRASVQILPTPSSGYSNIIKYYENFNQSQNNIISGVHLPYSKVDIEATGSCPNSPDSLYTNPGAEGASIYYSPLNSKLENQNGFIPDAEKYPFSTTLYTPDNTGRIKRQSGVGRKHKIGSNHETVYLYGDPDQEDLDKLFGSEAGYAERYKKNLVIDPNGQISVSYLNTENKVVATALAGNTPANVNSINSTSTSTTISTYFDYNDDNYDQINKQNSNSITFGKKITPTVTGTYTFSYNLTVPAYTDSCITGFCYDCVYDLEIKIVDECGAPKYSNTKKVGLPSGSSNVDYTCSSPIVYSTNGITPPFDVVLQAGKEYFLSKTLTINNDAMLQYLAHYMDTVAKNNTCLKTIKDFTASPTATVSSLGCGMTCTACAAQVVATYNAQNSSTSTVPTGERMTEYERDAAIKECMKPCNEVNLCEAQFENLLQDVRPNGQYAEYKLTAGLVDASGFELSIFNGNNKLPLTNIDCGPGGSTYTAFNIMYDVDVASYKNPEYYNLNTFDFTKPILSSAYTKNHYFNSDGTIGKIRLVVNPNGLGNYVPRVIDTSKTASIFTDNIGFWTYPENLYEVTDFVNNYISHPEWALSLVKYHPEFNYYLDCSRQTNPYYYPSTTNCKNFDSLLMSIDTYSVADAIFHFSSLASGHENDSDDLLNSDPYFNGSGPGHGSLKTIFQSKLTNYAAIPSTSNFLTAKAVAASMFSTANMYYSNCYGVFSATTITCSSITYTITSAAQNNMWKAYRNIYLAEKNKIITIASHTNAVSTGAQSNYFNGAIGNPNFNEWDAYHNYNFWPFFPFGLFGNNPAGFLLMLNTKYEPSFYPNCTGGSSPSSLYYPTFVSGYHDFGSPSSFYHKDKYAHKSRRFVDEQSMNNGLAGGATDPETVMANLINYANNEIQLNSSECPIYKRLELFLSSIFNNGNILDQTHYHPLVEEGSFTRDLYDKLTLCASLTPTATWYPNLEYKPFIDNTTKVLTIEFYKTVGSTRTHINTADIKLIPPSAGFDWTYLKILSSIHFAGTTGNTDNFTIMGAYVDPGVNPTTGLPITSGPPNTIPNNVTLTGTSDCLRSDCAPPAVFNCKPTQQALELQQFLNAVAGDYHRTSPTVTFPLDLADPNNFSSQNFSALVRYPFGNTAVSANSHQANIFPTTNQITLWGLNSYLTPTPGNLTITFSFTDVSGSGNNLTNVIGFTGLKPKQNTTDPYDFTIKAIYGTSGSLVYKTFGVNIIYPSTVCDRGPAYPCQTYNLTNCDDNVSSTCINDDGYQAGMDLFHFMQEAIQQDPNSTSKALNTFANYTGLLKTQTGASANHLISSVPQSSVTWTYDSGKNISSTGNIIYSFVNTTAPTQYTTCSITFSATIYGNILSGNLIGKVGNFADFKVLDPATGTFQFNMLTTNGNDFTFTGKAPCLKMANCEPCPIKDTLLFENFDTLNTSNVTSASDLPFTTNYTDMSSVNHNISFSGMNVCNIYSVSISQQFSILSDSYASCFGTKKAYDHTKVNPVRNFLSVYAATIKNPIVPYQKTLTTLEVGKQYEFSAYIRAAGDGNNELDIHKDIKLEINGGNNDIIIASTIYDTHPLGSDNTNIWYRVAGFFTATNSTTTIKIKLYQNNATSIQEIKFFIDDITLRTKQCETPPLFIPPVNTSTVNPCFSNMANIQTANAHQEMVYYLNNMKDDFIKNYTNKCLQSLEWMKAKFNNGEGHYTLYYYDQAGNLIKTIPPEGVEMLPLLSTFPGGGSLTYGQKIKNDRANHTKTVFTAHRMATRYEYNSLNQLIRQSTPDHSTTEQWNTTANSTFPSNLQTTNMDFADSQNGYMTANDGSVGYIYSTQDGGKNWSPISALGLANMIDFEVSGTTAYVITSDGNLLKSSNYTASVPTWNITNLSGSNLQELSDIKFVSSTNGYIVGKNGFVMETTNSGTSWNDVSFPTSNTLTKITSDATGTYVIISGLNGELYYKTPSTSGLFVKVNGINNLIDINDCAIVNTGNGTTTFLDLLICGKNKSGAVHKANLLELTNIDNPLYPIPPMSSFPLSGSSISNVSNTKFNSIALNNFVVSTVDHSEIYLGGVTESVPPKPLFVKLSKISPATTYTDANILATTTANASISKINIKDPGVSSDVYGTLSNGQLIKYNNTTTLLNDFINLNINTSVINTAPLNGMWINPSATNEGYVVGNNGAIIKFVESSGTATSNGINTISNPKLNAVTAAKDGSGYVYAVGDGGTVIYSSNSGSSWQTVSTGLGSINLNAALYMSPSKVVIAGSGSYVGELNASTNAITLVSSSGTTNYKTIKKTNTTNQVFIIGQNSGAVVSKYTLGGSLSSLGTTPDINDVEFIAPNIAFAVGNGGKVYQSTDNGTTFNLHTPSFTSVDLTKVNIVDQLTLYAFGNSSTIFKTTDGGLNWIQKAAPSGSGTNINAVYNLGNNNIIASGVGSPGLFNIYDKSDDYSSRFYYDALGRLIISQNSKQYNKINKAYSYTIYDELGRISQVGEISGSGLTDPDNIVISNGVIDLSTFTNWLTQGTKSEVTTTVYDKPATTIFASTVGFYQSNLRKRVSAIYIDNDGNLLNGYKYATIYSYDIHGNVKTLMNENPNVHHQQACKRIDYTYDLISGKVNTVSYQKGNADEFYHKYEYDADNRITNVLTSKDGYVWEQDAKYFYYPHGPLARTEIGTEKVQGIDYAYTLQGWIKGINSGNLTQTNDIGKDGDAANLYNPAIAGLNKFVSNDAASYSLNYYDHDYLPVNPTNTVVATRFYLNSNSVAEVNDPNNWLYNGNISSMATTITNPSTRVVLPQLMAYKYDQLNRLSNANSYTFLSGNDIDDNITHNYNNYFSYDANGNIDRQKRFDASGTVVDSLIYRYHTNGTGKKLSNRLYHVNDVVTGSLPADDIEDEGTFTPAPTTGNLLGQINSANNYAYDEIGNLVKDVSEGIQNIEWNVYGKISKITRVTGFVKPGASTPPSDLEFVYDPAGNRIEKIEKQRDLSGLLPSSNWKHTYYSRDAQGNVMATYENNSNPGFMDLKEHHLYGSSRLGIKMYDGTHNIEYPSKYDTWSDVYVQNRETGTRLYEISNHLGNVLTVVSDRKLAETGNCAGLEFDGSDDFVTIPHNSSYNFGTGDFTIEARVKANGGQPSPYPAIISSRTASAGYGTGFVLYLLDGIPTIYMNGFDIVSGDIDIRDETWHHLAVTRSGTNVSLYIDGTNVGSASSSGNISSGHPILIGMENFDPSTTAFMGNIDELRLWNVARTASEINIYNSNYLIGNETGLVGYWHLNEGSGQSSFDHTGNSNTASLGTDNTGTGNDPIWQTVPCIVPQVNYAPDILSSTDYYPFGSQMPGRHFESSANKYKYGFNGKENDNETVGTGEGTQDYGMRIYNPALGRFLSVDPLQKDFAWNSSYAFAENDVIRAIDLDGSEKSFQIEYTDKSGTKLWHTVPYSQIHPGQEFGPLGQGDYVYYKDVNTGKMVGHYNETYEEASPVRSTLQEADAYVKNNPPFESLEVGAKTTERVGNIKVTQKASYTDDGKSLKGKISNDVEVSSIAGKKVNINAAVYIKGNINKSDDNATKTTITVPLPFNLYINTTYRLDDQKVESVEIGIGAKASEPQVEFKEKITPVSGSITP